MIGDHKQPGIIGAREGDEGLQDLLALLRSGLRLRALRYRASTQFWPELLDSIVPGQESGGGGAPAALTHPATTVGRSGAEPLAGDMPSFDVPAWWPSATEANAAQMTALKAVRATR